MVPPFSVGLMNVESTPPRARAPAPALAPAPTPVAGQLAPLLGHNVLASSLSPEVVPRRCRLLADAAFAAAVGATVGVQRGADGGFALSPGQAVVRPLITRARAVALVLALGTSTSPGEEAEDPDEEEEEEKEEGCAGVTPSPGGGGADVGVGSTGRVATPGSTCVPCVLPFPPAPAAAAEATLLLVRRPIGAPAGPVVRAAAIPQLSSGSSLAGRAEDTEPLSPPATLTAATAAAPPSHGVSSTTPAGTMPASAFWAPVLIGDLPSGAAEFVSSLTLENALENIMRVSNRALGALDHHTGVR